MDFRESCISSFFVHVCAVLLLAVVSRIPVSQPGSLVVSLSADSFEKTSEAGQSVSGEVKEAASQETAMAAEEAAVEKAENPEEANAVPEAPPAVPEEQKAAENPQMANAAPPGVGQDMKELARMHHVIAIHKRAFVETASQSIQKSLHKEIASDPSGDLNQGTAEVIFYFNEWGGIGEIWGSSGLEKLQAVLAKPDWQTVPSPADFRF